MENNQIEPRKIGIVKLGEKQNREADLVSKMENGRYFQEADGIAFDGHRVLWAFSYQPHTYLKESELSGDEWRKGGYMQITRDGISVYREFCREPERAFRELAWVLPRLQDFPWEYVKIGHKLYNHDIPCTITSICDDGEVIVESESGEPFPWAFKQEDKKEDPDGYEDEWGPRDRMHVLSEHLYWHRK